MSGPDCTGAQLTLWHVVRPAADLVDMWRHCRDCGIDVIERREWYMLKDAVWPLAPDGGVLCVLCVEQHIGRRLVPADFKDVPANREGGHSERLASRLGAAGYPVAHSASRLERGNIENAVRTIRDDAQGRPEAKLR